MFDQVGDCSEGSFGFRARSKSTGAMMARPQLVMETWGKIRRTSVRGKPTAIAYYRDSDGVTRAMQRQGSTPAAAERALVQALKDRLAPAGDDLTGESRVGLLAKLWLAETAERDLSPGTIVKYREIVAKHIVRGLGDVRLNEATVPRLDRFLKAFAKSSGPSSHASFCPRCSRLRPVMAPPDRTPSATSGALRWRGPVW